MVPVCSICCNMHFSVGEIISADCFKYEITPSLKENDRLKFHQNTEMNHVKFQVKSGCKLSSKVFKEQDGYDPL